MNQHTFVFVIEDGPASRGMYVQQLREFGFYKVQSAASEREGAGRLDREPEVILYNDNMARAVSRDAIKKIKRARPEGLVYIAGRGNNHLAADTDGSEECRSIDCEVVASASGGIARLREVEEAPRPGQWGRLSGVFTKRIA